MREYRIDNREKLNKQRRENYAKKNLRVRPQN